MKKTTFTLNSTNTLVETISFTYNMNNAKEFGRRLLKHIANNYMGAIEKDVLCDLIDCKEYQQSLNGNDFVIRVIKMIKDTYASRMYGNTWIKANIIDFNATIEVWQDDSLD
jgi:hypothetical protein